MPIGFITLLRLCCEGWKKKYCAKSLCTSLYTYTYPEILNLELRIEYFKWVSEIYILSSVYRVFGWKE